MTQVVKKINSIFFYFFAVISLFCYIYQFNLMFLGLPVINSSVQVGWLLMVFYSIFVLIVERKSLNLKLFKTFGRWKKHVKYFIVLFVYSLFLILIVGWGDGTNISLEIIKIFIYGVLMFWIWSLMFDSIDEFMGVLLVTGIIQTIIIYYCIFDPMFAFILDETVNSNPALEHHDIMEMREGYAGGIGCISSFGLIKYTLTGLFPCTYFCVKKQSVLYLIIFIIMAFCASMIARTGLICDFICVSYIILKRFKGFKTGSIITLCIVVLFGVWAVYYLFTSSKYDDFIEERFYRYEQLTDDSRQSFVEAYFHGQNTKYPPINTDTFLGVGITSGQSANGYYVNVDGGPMRQYSAIGILGCLLFYFLIMRNQVKTIKLLHNKNNRHLLWLLFLFLIIGELKETTYMALWPLLFFFFVSYLLEVEENRNMNIA